MGKSAEELLSEAANIIKDLRPALTFANQSFFTDGRYITACEQWLTEFQNAVINDKRNNPSI